LNGRYPLVHAVFPSSLRDEAAKSKESYRRYTFASCTIYPNPILYTKSGSRKKQLLFQTLLMELPALRSVCISKEGIGRDMDSVGKARLVTSIIKLASIFRNIQKLELPH
jgi:hypothetical protein